MRYVNPVTQGIASVQEIRDANPSISIPDDADLTDIGYSKLTETPPPTVPDWYVIEPGVPLNENGVWRTDWSVRAMTSLERADEAVRKIAELEVELQSPPRIVREGLILLVESQAKTQGLTIEYLRAKNKGYRLLKECDEQIAELRKNIP